MESRKVFFVVHLDIEFYVSFPKHIIKGILATPPKLPPRNKGLIAGLIKGNQWFFLWLTWILKIMQVSHHLRWFNLASAGHGSCDQ